MSKKGIFKKKAKDVLGNTNTLNLTDFLDDTKEDQNIYSITLDKIQDNPYQPRQNFDEEKLQELADSIQKYGVIQPIVVRLDKDSIFLVAGERRLRASKLAGLDNIPAIITQGNALEISLIENLQRENLDPFEEAEALQKMIETYHYTQEKLAKVVGKSRTSITKSLSINKIPQAIKEQCERVHIPKRTLLEVAKQKSEDEMQILVDKIMNFELKAEDIQREKKKNTNVNKKIDPSKLNVKKMKAFKKYIESIESKISEKDADTINEMKNIQAILVEIISRFEIEK